MRHNKMAGNRRFLLGKNMPSGDLTTSRKKKPSQTFTKHLLHSKSTYFYRWFSSNSKKSNEGHSFSNTTYLIPSVCGVALLIGLGLTFNPISNSTNKALLGNSNGSAYAETITSNPTDYSSISMTLSNNGTELDNEDTVSTNVAPGLVSYIDNSIKISTSKIDRFYVTVQAAENSTSELTGTAHGETIAPVGSSVAPTNFPDNSWGYALANITTGDISSNSLTYNSLPTYNTAITPQYTSAQNLQDGEYSLKLTFAAKINADKPSDHYTTKAMVSVAADARYISGFINLDTDQPITTMQEMTSSICKNAPDGYSTQLIDDRSISGLGQTTYWVTKLKDGKCWMTQNLDLTLAEGDVLKPEDTDTTSDYIVPTLYTYLNPGMYNYKPSAASSDYYRCGNLTASGCSDYFEAYTGKIDGDELAHYLVGDYYPWTVAMAGTTEEDADSICPKGWRLPTKPEYDMLIDGVANTNAVINTIRTSPYYFIPAGAFGGDYYRVADYGVYWTSTINSDNFGYYLYFQFNSLYVASHGYSSTAYSVRCVAK